ncbi:MAG: GNAT family N-acetyltransferase [Pseudomonadota bacterium]
MEELKTERLRLIPFDLSHTEMVHQMSVDPEVRRYLWEGKIIPVQQIEDMVNDSCDCFSQHGSGFFAMFVNLASDPHNGAFVGFCGHRVFDSGQDNADADDQIELLFAMQPRFWGRGYGQEAARAVLRHGFEACGFERVIAATDTPNQRSVNVLQSLGMSFMQRREWRGLDTVFYQLSATEFDV